MNEATKNDETIKTTEKEASDFSAQGLDEAAKPDYKAEIAAVIRGNATPIIMKEKLEDYHERDIAEVLNSLSLQERRKLYRILDSDMLSTILEYTEEDDAGRFLNEIDLKKIPQIVEAMETDFAVKVLRELNKEKRALIMDLLDDKAKDSIAVTGSFADDEIGSFMTSNFIRIKGGQTINSAMTSLKEQAVRNDNISVLFAVDEKGVFTGAVDLRDLITADQTSSLDELVINSFPYVYGQEAIDDCLEKLKDYSESSVPVLDNSNRILGVITAQNIIEASDNAMGEDYAMFAGLTAEEDLEEPIPDSLKKRLPWLLVLMALGLVVSSVVGAFEQVVAQLTMIMAFQSLILDMAGNVGTQSLAVTIRVLTSEGLTFKQKVHLVFKEMRIGLFCGTVLGLASTALIGLFIHYVKGQTWAFSYAVSGCIGLSLMISMIAAGAAGTLIPLFFKRLKVDPAVASGPLITTLNDLVAVVCYYSLAWALLIKFVHPAVKAVQ